jgi:hypothetical protein
MCIIYTVEYKNICVNIAYIQKNKSHALFGCSDPYIRYVQILLKLFMITLIEQF